MPEIDYSAVLVALITGYFTFLATKKKVSADLTKAQAEAKAELDQKNIVEDSNVQSIYTQNMNVILSEYKEQVSGFRSEVGRLNTKIDDLEKKYETDISAYKTQVEFLEEKVEDLEVEKSHLKEENEILKSENEELKGERTNGSNHE